MIKVNPSKGQSWNIGGIIQTVKSNDRDIVLMVEGAGYGLYRFEQESFTFVPANDLEWLAVNAGEVSEGRYYSRTSEDTIRQGGAPIFGYHTALAITNKRYELSAEPIAAPVQPMAAVPQPKHSDALRVCAAIYEGLNSSYYPALTGGQLYKEGARKDIDIVIYRNREAPKFEISDIQNELADCGLYDFQHYGFVTKCKFDGLDVDLLNPESVSGDKYGDRDRLTPGPVPVAPVQPIATSVPACEVEILSGEEGRYACRRLSDDHLFWAHEVVSETQALMAKWGHEDYEYNDPDHLVRVTIEQMLEEGYKLT